MAVWTGRMGCNTPRDSKGDSREQPGTGNRQYLLDRRTYLSLGAVAVGASLTSGVRAESTENDVVKTYWTDFSEGEL